jgi:hypothetical protein
MKEQENMLAMEGELEKDWRKKERKGVREEKREGREFFANIERERIREMRYFPPKNI